MKIKKTVLVTVLQGLAWIYVLAGVFVFDIRNAFYFLGIGFFVILMALLVRSKCGACGKKIVHGEQSFKICPYCGQELGEYDVIHWRFGCK